MNQINLGQHTLSGKATKKNILISGGGIAGPTLAYWLVKAGHKVTLVERALSTRLSGQTVDIRDEGKEVVARMGLEARIASLMTNEDGLRFVDSSDRIRAEYPRAGGKKSFVTDIEILRADLARLLHDETKEKVEYIFGNYITSCEETDAGVCVSFAHGPDRKFDLMIVADGMRSRTRELIFGPVPVRHIGLYTAYFAIPYEPQDGTWVRWSNCVGGKSILVRPDNGRSSRAYLYIRSNERGIDLNGPAAAREFIQKRFANDGWEAPRILRAMRNADDFYFEDLGQIHMQSWSKGRVAVVGDAAYCATPVSGMGTTLAIVGAYILASELSYNDNHQAAFSRYELRMRPYAARAQAIKPWTIRVEQPSSRAGIELLYAMKWLESTRLFSTHRQG